MSHPRNLPWPPEVRARALKLRGLGLKLREVEELTGVPKQTIGQWERDPDGSTARARRESYCGTCEWCGAATDGSRGAAHAPRTCNRCGPTLNRKWTHETVIAAIRRFADRYGRQPTATDFLGGSGSTDEQRERFFADGDYPYQGYVHKVCGSWNAAIAAAGFEPWRSGMYGRPGEDMSNPLVQEVLALYATGLGSYRIAERLGISPGTVLTWCHKAGVVRSRAKALDLWNGSRRVAA